MAIVSYQPGHGWRKHTKIKGGWIGGYGINPQPQWETPNSMSETIEAPQVGDTVEFYFSSHKWTRPALWELGLDLNDDDIVIKKE